MDSQNQNTSSKGFLSQLEEFFNTYLHKKAPFHLPPTAREWIVKYGPWITLVLMVLALPVILAILGLGSIFGAGLVMTGYGSYHYTYLLSGIFALVSFVMEALALPGLFARSLKGWQMVYYAVLVGAIGQLVGGNIIGMIIDVIISMYFLFEIREYYK
jgi:hypothetical protein